MGRAAAALVPVRRLVADLPLARRVPLREVYNLAQPGTALYDAYAAELRTRYRLMPYIYSLAGDTYLRDGTIMRGLVMDFPTDLKARDIADQYMFGHALLVAPVTEYKARSRSVYFAGAEWYDLQTGQKYAGGQSTTVAAALDKIPVFVRAGSILPTGPAITYTAEKLDGPLTLVVYTGANGVFSCMKIRARTTATNAASSRTSP